MPTDKSYFDNVSEQISLTTGAQIDGFKKGDKERDAISQNENLSDSTADTAHNLNAVDTGIQTFSALTGTVDNIAQSVLLPAMAALGMKGIASFPITKQMDPVVGIDVHTVMIPPAPAPIPMPHPYIGMLFKAEDFIAAALASFIAPPPPAPEGPKAGEKATEAQQQATNDHKKAELVNTGLSMVVGMIGATVKIGGFIPRTVAGTPTKNIPHFPMGATFAPLPPTNTGHAMLGSLFALADNDPIAGGGMHLHLSCQSLPFGMPSVHATRKSKNTSGGSKEKMTLYLPTSMVMPIPMAQSIITSPIPAPFNPMALLTKAVKGAFGRHFNKLAAKVGHGAINKTLGNSKLANKLHKKLCTKTGHPVDVASGMFFTDEEDFFLPGPIPLSWERSWYAESDYKGPLGNGWHHSYDIAIVEDEAENNVSLRMPDGRPLAFRKPTTAIPTFRKGEQMELRINDSGAYHVWDINEDVYYHFTTEKFNGVQKLRSIVNANSFSIQFNYNKEGHLIQITDAAHRVLQVTNDKDGRITQITAPHPEFIGQKFTIASYVYDAKGNMLQQTNAVGDSMHFEYEGYLMVKETWRNGLKWFFRYDGKEIGSRCIQTWGDNNIYNHKLEFYDGLTKVENSLGHVTEYYHRGGLVHKKVEPNGAINKWLYDEDNQLTSITDPLGNCYLYSYDDLGNQIQSIDPAGAIVETEYSLKQGLERLPIKIKDANGGIWKWEYDAQGNVIKRTNPLGASSVMHYQDGLLQTITDALGNTTNLFYDAQYNIKEIRDGLGNVSSYKYDILGNSTKVINPKGAIQTKGFDLVSRVTEVSNFDGNKIHLKYDGIDNLLKYQDTHQEVNYSYSGMWKMTRRSDNRGTTYYYYDTEEQLTKIINEKGNPYTFTLDSVGNVTKEQSFDEATKHFKRDLAGRVLELTKASGKKVKYRYDASSRITEIDYGNENTQVFNYNPAGQLLNAINNDAEVVFTRNTLGLITKEEVDKQSITNQYNNLGVRTQLESSLDAHINYAHDTFGNLANLTASQNSNNWEAQYKHDSLGFELERLLPGNLEQQFSYDNIGRLTTQQTRNKEQKKHQRRYTWGINDRLQKTDDSKQGITKYSYTPTGHLEMANFQNGEQQVRSSDNVGNLYETTSNNDREYSQGGRLEKKGSWNYKYDADGFLIEKYKGSSSIFRSKKDHWQYQWNDAGMLQTVTRPDKLQVHFTYDALGRRLSKTFKSTTTKWLWDGNVPLHEWKENQNGDILSNSTVGDNGIVTWVFEENSFIPTAKLKNNKKFSILADHLGTPTSMHNAEGEQVWERKLDAFGKAIVGDNSSCPFMFQGQYYDAETDVGGSRTPLKN